MCKEIIPCYLNLLYFRGMHCFCNTHKGKAVHSPVFSYISINIDAHRVYFASLRETGILGLTFPQRFQRGFNWTVAVPNRLHFVQILMKIALIFVHIHYAGHENAMIMA